VFAFLPICQLRAGHATVDIFTSGLPDTANRVLLAIWEVLAAAVLALIAWRLGAGLASKLGNGETTFLLQFPVWWAYAASSFPPSSR
jgi:TRAP-type C4-dicarboxylate transport system permease small subunit